MRLHDQWRALARRHSISHGTMLVALLSGGEVALPLISDAVPMQYRLAYGGLVTVVVAASFIAKLVVSKDQN